MKQYCRYCTNFCTGNGNYCSEKNKTMSEASAKAINFCKKFDFNPIDAFDIDKRYKPREIKENQCDGQINLMEQGGYYGSTKNKEEKEI